MKKSYIGYQPEGYTKVFEGPFNKKIAYELLTKQQLPFRTTKIILSWGVADKFMEALKTDPSMNWEYYESLLDEKKTVKREWKRFYDAYKKHLDTIGKSHDFDFGFLYGVPLTFSSSVEQGHFILEMHTQ